jgi:16S rRNA (guanine966-N2)-methyltransferase
MSRMRIVGGTLKGRPLTAPEGLATRPTSERVREAIFNILSHGIDEFDLDGARVLDLFAGTGALGLEAISRGARFAQFVEEDAQARGSIRQNAETLGLIGQAKIWRRDATKLGPCAPLAPFSLIFADPPYHKGFGTQCLASILQGGWAAPRAVIVLEEALKVQIALPAGVELLQAREYGETQVLFLRAP